jgi:isoleucyl-tRNA synthetase
LGGSDISHSYPHCWRCKNPIIFRATEQWFISMQANDLRVKALEAINQVAWIPRWGRERIYGRVENRPDWCISRQRAWGVPMSHAGRWKHFAREILTALFLARAEGADIWFSRSPENCCRPTAVA